MNKIYKVIWSKVRNCYVAVSEIAKRNGKSCTSVNCGGKSNRTRSLRMAAATLGVAAALVGGVGFGSPVAWAEDVAGGETRTINDETMANEKFYLDGSNITFTVGAGGAVYNISGNSTGPVNGNNVVINGGTITNADVEYDNSTWLPLPSGINGGYSTTGAVSDNHVTITNATIGGYYPTAYGGHSDSGAVSKNTVTIENNNSNLFVYGGHSITGTVGGDDAADGNVVTMKSGAVNYIAGGWSGSNEDGGSVKNNQVTVEDGTVGSQIYGGASDGGSVELNRVIFEKGSTIGIFGGQSGGKDALNNTVTINDGTVTNVYGGQAVAGWISGDCGDVKGNQVTINDGTINGVVYGGYSTNGTAGGATAEKGNKVTITGGTVNAIVYGGYVNSGTGDARNNVVSISGSTTTAGSVYGGRTYKGAAKENGVTISGAKVTGGVYGGFAYTGSSATEGIASGNYITISEKDGNVAKVTRTVYGGYGYSTTGNYVTVTAGEIGGAYGGYSTGSIEGNSSGNIVEVSGNKTKVGSITGGHSTYGTAGGVAEGEGNKVIINGGEVNGDVYGGYVLYGGVASGNTVEINDGILGNNIRVFGGRTDSYSYDTGEAKSNTVAINGGTMVLDIAVYGGYSDNGNAGGDSEAEGNTVVINNVNGGIYVTGGHSASNGSANYNSVTIDKATVARTYGGYAYALTASHNKVDIKNGSTVNGDLYGGFSSKGAASSNRVSIDNSTISGNVYAGYGYQDTINNTVELNDATVTGNVYGGKSSNGDGVSGNTLILSGTSTVGASIQNFASFKLADTVSWVDGATILQANQFAVNADDTRASLDIKDAESNLASATSGQMTLLGSDTADDFKTLSLIYSGSDSPVALSETNQSKVLKSGAETTETTPVNGVTLTYASSHTVSLDADNSYKNVLYKVDSIPSKISLGDMTWGTGRDLAGAFIFGSGAVVDATNLTFGDITTALSVNDSMVLAENATGITSAITPTEGNNKTVKIKDYTDSATGIGYEATASGNVTAGTGVVKYTVGSVTADKITLTSREWGTAADAMPDTWKASASTEVDGTNFVYTGTATTALKANDTAAILNAPGLTTASSVTGGADKTLAVDYTDSAAGIKYVAEATGHVAAAANAVNYVVDSVAVNSVDLSGWNGTGTSAVTDGWTGNGVAVTTGSFAAPTDLAAGSARDIVTASAGFFTDEAITGVNKYGNGETFTETEQAGVTLAGHKVGGVKADADGAKLTYYAMNKTGDTLTLGEAKFVANGTVAKYGSEYDLTAAAINADGLKFAEGQDAMKAGAVMTVVDATGAKKGTGDATLASFASKTYEVDFTDPIEGKALTLTGKHTDTLAQDTAKTKLTYTVGEKKVETAAFTGTVNWNPDAAYQENTGYTFSDATKIDASKLSMAGNVTTALAPGESMTLLSAAGLKETNSVEQPTAAGSINVA